jgi:hypothetical protein
MLETAIKIEIIDDLGKGGKLYLKHVENHLNKFLTNAGEDIMNGE